jgi:hypothetical protein
MCLLKKRHFFLKQFIERSVARKFIKFFALSTSEDILNGVTIISTTCDIIILTYNKPSYSENLLGI